MRNWDSERGLGSGAQAQGRSLLIAQDTQNQARPTSTEMPKPGGTGTQGMPRPGPCPRCTGTQSAQDIQTAQGRSNRIQAHSTPCSFGCCTRSEAKAEGAWLETSVPQSRAGSHGSQTGLPCVMQLCRKGQEESTLGPPAPPSSHLKRNKAVVLPTCLPESTRSAWAARIAVLVLDRGRPANTQSSARPLSPPTANTLGWALPGELQFCRRQVTGSDSSMLFSTGAVSLVWGTTFQEKHDHARKSPEERNTTNSRPREHDI